MSNLDLILKNGIVFLPQGRTSIDVGIKDGKIVEIGNCVDANKQQLSLVKLYLV